MRNKYLTITWVIQLLMKVKILFTSLFYIIFPLHLPLTHLISLWWRSFRRKFLCILCTETVSKNHSMRYFLPPNVKSKFNFGGLNTMKLVLGRSHVECFHWLFMGLQGCVALACSYFILYFFLVNTHTPTHPPSRSRPSSHCS